MIEALLIMAGLGLLASLGLGLAGRIFSVEIDPRIEQAIDLLPGANCGGCSFAGCTAYATAVIEGKAQIGLCPVNSEENDKAIAKMLGVKASKKEKLVAVLHCQGDYTRSVRRYQYFGIMTCKAAHLLSGGAKECPFGCLGYGDCQNACSFDSITIVDGLNHIEKQICTGCGACVKACPRDLIDLVPISKKVHVLCKSTDKGGAVTKYCAIGCIGCKKCEKVCPVDAIHVTNFLAEISYDKCINCGKCAEECPNNVIIDEVLIESGPRPFYEITTDCTGCTLCKKKCPMDAVSGEKKELHTIDQEKCVQCGICYDVCKKKTFRLIDPQQVASHMVDGDKIEKEIEDGERV